MLNVNLSIRADDGLGVVALRGEFDLAGAPGVASHLITAVAVGGPSVIVDLAALEGAGYSGLAGFCPGRRPRSSGSMPPWYPDAVAAGRYAALRIIRWSGRCADTKRAGRGASRVLAAFIGVRPAEERRPDSLWLLIRFVMLTNAW